MNKRLIYSLSGAALILVFLFLVNIFEKDPLLEIIENDPVTEPDPIVVEDFEGEADPAV